MRALFEIIAEKQLDISKYIDLSKIEIKRLWTVYDEEQLYKSNNTDAYSIKTLDDLKLKHNEGVFLEDYIHDWDIRNGKLNYCSRVVEQGEQIKILVEYETR